jgi:hypothetical protein
MKALSLSVMLLLATAGCASGARRSSLPERPAGCEVEIVREGVPARPVRSIGQVVARCVGTAANDEPRCLRVLQDQACRLGADVIWDLTSGPLPEDSPEPGILRRAAAGVYR